MSASTGLQDTGALAQARLSAVEALLDGRDVMEPDGRRRLDEALDGLRRQINDLSRLVEEERRGRRAAERDARSEAAAAEAVRAAMIDAREEAGEALIQQRISLANEAAALLWRNRHALRAELRAFGSPERPGASWGDAGEGQPPVDAVGRRDDLLRAILGSSSWRLSRPLRRVMALARRRSGPSIELASLPELLAGPAREEPGSRPSLLPERRMRAPTPAFPLPGHVAALSELAGSTGEMLDASVSVIIPTYNAGAEFYWLLQKLNAQKGLRKVEIVIVDSGSTDGTLELARQAGCRIVPFDKAEFSHSHTRNVGADHADGDLLLFTVQDAYPVGDYWLHAMARCLLHPSSEEERLAAVSCAEFPRSDSELFYNALIDTHYRFLQCHDRDRVGRLVSDDNASIRVQGQLSDIACMTPRSIFMQYRYHGRYAEDLLYGIRLVRDGLRAGMLSSVRVIHSHHRTTSYHFRRVFVDVLFLHEVFSDMAMPEAISFTGTMLGGYDLQFAVRSWSAAEYDTASDAFEVLLERLLEQRSPRRMTALDGDGFGYAPMAVWTHDYVATANRVDQLVNAEEAQDWRRLRQSFIDRLRHLKNYSDTVFTRMDARVALEVQGAAEKALAMSVGAHLAYIYLNRELDGDLGDIAELKPMLLEGI